MPSSLSNLLCCASKRMSFGSFRTKKHSKADSTKPQGKGAKRSSKTEKGLQDNGSINGIEETADMNGSSM